MDVFHCVKETFRNQNLHHTLLGLGDYIYYGIIVIVSEHCDVVTSHVNKFEMVTHTIVEELDLENKPPETVYCVNNLTTEKAYLLQTVEFLKILLFSLY